MKKLFIFMAAIVCSAMGIIPSSFGMKKGNELRVVTIEPEKTYYFDVAGQENEKSDGSRLMFALKGEAVERHDLLKQLVLAGGQSFLIKGEVSSDKNISWGVASDMTKKEYLVACSHASKEQKNVAENGLALLRKNGQLDDIAKQIEKKMGEKCSGPNCPMLPEKLQEKLYYDELVAAEEKESDFDLMADLNSKSSQVTIDPTAIYNVSIEIEGGELSVGVSGSTVLKSDYLTERLMSGKTKKVLDGEHEANMGEAFKRALEFVDGKHTICPFVVTAEDAPSFLRQLRFDKKTVEEAEEAFKTCNLDDKCPCLKEFAGK